MDTSIFLVNFYMLIANTIADQAEYYQTKPNLENG